MERIKLIEMGEAFWKLEEAHQLLIAESQARLVDLSQDLMALSLEPQKIESMAEYIERTEDININMRSYRSQFYNLILRITELLKLISDYHIDQEKMAANQVALEFDALIGGE